MLKTGDQHLESLRDGRTIYIGKEKVTDVTTHPAFCNAARSMAAIYDMKAAPENRDGKPFMFTPTMPSKPMASNPPVAAAKTCARDLSMVRYRIGASMQWNESTANPTVADSAEAVCIGDNSWSRK